MRAIGRGFTTRLSVGFTQNSLDIVTEMVSRMGEEGGAVSFSLHQGEPQLLESMVERRQLDFAVTHLPVANPSLGVEVLATMKLMLFVRSDVDRWVHDSPITTEMLSGVPLILLRRRSGPGVYERILDAFAAAGVACSVIADSNDLAAVYPLVERGAGVGLLLVHDFHVARPGFSIIPVEIASAPERLALVYPRGRRMLPAIQKAMDLCRGSLRRPHEGPSHP